MLLRSSFAVGIIILLCVIISKYTQLNSDAVRIRFADTSACFGLLQSQSPSSTELEQAPASSLLVPYPSLSVNTSCTMRFVALYGFVRLPVLCASVSDAPVAVFSVSTAMLLLMSAEERQRTESCRESGCASSKH